MNDDTRLSIPVVQVPPISNLTQNLLADAARAWRLPQKAIIVIAFTPFIVTLSGVVAAILGKDVYKWYTREDGVVENLQVTFWALALVICFLTIRKMWQAGEKGMAFYTDVRALGSFSLWERRSAGGSGSSGGRRLHP